MRVTTLAMPRVGGTVSGQPLKSSKEQFHRRAVRSANWMRRFLSKIPYMTGALQTRAAMTRVRRGTANIRERDVSCEPTRSRPPGKPGSGDRLTVDRHRTGEDPRSTHCACGETAGCLDREAEEGRSRLAHRPLAAPVPRPNACPREHHNDLPRAAGAARPAPVTTSLRASQARQRAPD